jgi:hypothetical protein
MKKIKTKKKVFYSIMEFEKAFLPKSFEEKMSKEPTDPNELGITLAKQSLDKIKNVLLE